MNDDLCRVSIEESLHDKPFVNEWSENEIRGKYEERFDEITEDQDLLADLLIESGDALIIQGSAMRSFPDSGDAAHRLIQLMVDRARTQAKEEVDDKFENDYGINF